MTSDKVCLPIALTNEMYMIRHNNIAIYM